MRNVAVEEHCTLAAIRLPLISSSSYPSPLKDRQKIAHQNADAFLGLSSVGKR
jgi:hypothetical protein